MFSMLKPLLCLLLAALPAAAAKPTPAPAPKGTLVIVGGGGMPDEILDAFLAAGGGPKAVMGLIPTSTSDPKGAYEEWKADLDKRGIALRLLDVQRREDASRPELLEAAKGCTAFWFSGGDQNRVGDMIVGTPLQQVILERYRAGAVIGGTSAGAAIMSKTMLTGIDHRGQESLEEAGRGAYRTREGMGFLPAFCIVDQHFLRRNRQNRLVSLAMDHPGTLGFGIDEATALVVKNGAARVLGERKVMVFDNAPMRLVGEGFRDLRVHLLTRGQGFDFKTRKPLP